MRQALAKAVAGPSDRLFWIDRFLRPPQCASILNELQFTFWQPSLVYAAKSDGRYHHIPSERRISRTTSERWFSAQLRRTIKSIDRRIERLVPDMPRRREEWQATAYTKGGRFHYHQDSGHFAEEPAGERTHTIVIYLDTPGRGGATHFPLLDLEVAPVAGRLLVWTNLQPDGQTDPDMLHASTPLIEGDKTILVTWLRERCVAAPATKDI